MSFKKYYTPDCYIPCDNDKYMTAGSYEPFEAMQKRIDYNGKAGIIQKCYRSWKMLKNIKECTEEYRRIVDDCRKYENERDDLHRKRHQIEIFRQLEPKKRSDFDKIYSLIEGWRNSRLNLIKNKFFKASSNTEHCQVLEKTVEMLKSVEKQRKSILVRHREKKFLNFLNFHCKPVKWNRDSGEPIEMITMRNQRAREYKILYDGLGRNHVKLEERMEMLILLKRTLEPHNCKAAYELKNLIEQEILLSSRQIGELSLENLKKRISCNYSDSKVVGDEWSFTLSSVFVECLEISWRWVFFYDTEDSRQLTEFFVFF